MWRSRSSMSISPATDFYFTLRSLLFTANRILAAFDEAFRVFWPPPSQRVVHDRYLGRSARSGGSGPRRSTCRWAIRSRPDDPSLVTLPEPFERVAAMSYGAHEVSRVKDFSQFTEEELRRGEAMIADLTWGLGMRRTRRWEAGRGHAPDLRRVVRRNIRYGGELLAYPRRDRALKRRPLVLICDVSGSRSAMRACCFTHSQSDLAMPGLLVSKRSSLPTG